jgi:Tfp pilus assembly protein PilW
MAVFAVLMSVLMQFFSSAQKVYTSTAGKTEMFENARIAMDMIARDLQSIYYNQDTHSYFKNTDSNPDQLSMVTTLSSVPNSSCSSRVAEVTYKLDTGSDTLKINVTGDDSSNWNFLSIVTPTDPFSPVDTSFGTDGTGYQEIIPYVMDFQVTALTKGGTVQTFPTATSPYATLPYMVKIDLTLLDRDSYTKWKAMPSGTAKNNMKNNNTRTFSKMVIIDRGQY